MGWLRSGDGVVIGWLKGGYGWSQGGYRLVMGWLQGGYGVVTDGYAMVMRWNTRWIWDAGMVTEWLQCVPRAVTGRLLSGYGAFTE